MTSSVARLAPRPKHVLIGLAGLFVVVGVFVGVAYARTGIPSPSAIASQQTTTIYASDAKTILARIGNTNRTDVPLSDVPVGVQHAMLAAEDRHFYSEPGVSPTGIVRALFVDVKGGDVTQGGSTITQQYAKNAYLSSQRSITRKLKEIVIATKLGQSRSKSTILDDYLNTIYFGRNAYGIDAASKAYFGVKSVKDLSVSQGALLAAVIRGPSIYDPRVNPKMARDRWQYVLDGMVKQHWLTQQQAGGLQFPDTRTVMKVSSACQGTNCYIRDAVERELKTRDNISQDQLDLGGYKVVTTIDAKTQKALVAAEQSVLPNQNGTPESGAASIKPGDGAIEALYGGFKYGRKGGDGFTDLSGATGAWGRPGGSSFKVFTMLAALRQGISLNSTYNGPTEVDVDGATIHNSSPGESCYGCTLTNALARSINTIFVPLAKQVGPDKVAQAAYDAGIPKKPALDAVPDIALGPADVSAVSLANAYATVAAQGIHAEPYLVKRVSTATGHTLFTAHKHTDRAFSSKITADATYAMTKVLDTGGTAAGRELSGRPAAGKTGTTSSNTNAWFTGFTPQLCTSVWIGNHDAKKTLNSAGSGEVFGGTLPAEIWQQAMNAALVGVPVVQFPPAAGVGSVEHSAGPTATTTSTVSPSSSATTTTSSSPTATPTATATASPSATASSHPPTVPPVTGSPSSSPSGGASPGGGDGQEPNRRPRHR